MKTRLKIFMLVVLNVGLAAIIFSLVVEGASSLRLGEARAAFDVFLVAALTGLLSVFFLVMLKKAWRGIDWPKSSREL